MKSSSFMIETSALPGVIFSQGPQRNDKNRLFNLQAGESIHIRSNIEQQSYLYLLKGETRIALPERSVILTEGNKSSPKAFVMPMDSAAIVEVTAVANTLLYHIDGKRLDDIVTWLGIAQSLENEPEKLGILSKVLTTRSLTNLPVESVYELISRMKLKRFKKGTAVVKQGDQARHFYILHQGEAEVWAQGLYDDKQKLVNTLTEGDSFGEDALVTGGTRNATVKMKTDGVLLVGNQDDFKQLIASPCIDEVDVEMARVMMDKGGYQLLDVRYEEEFEDSYIDGCRLIPLHELRDRYQELDINQKYITYCRSGKRSAVAALILKRKKFHVASMRGGINQWPYETKNMY